MIKQQKVAKIPIRCKTVKPASRLYIRLVHPMCNISLESLCSAC